jgi:hypothetical protein
MVSSAEALPNDGPQQWIMIIESKTDTQGGLEVGISCALSAKGITEYLFPLEAVN